MRPLIPPIESSCPRVHRGGVSWFSRAPFLNFGLVVPPQLQRLTTGVLGQSFVYDGDEVALKDACAVGS